MSECKSCGRDDGHYLGCAEAAKPIKLDVIHLDPVETANPAEPDAATVEEVTATILAFVGSEQMSQLYGAMDDLLHEYYEPYQSMSDSTKAQWRRAVAEELGGEGCGDPSPKAQPPAEHCAFGECTEPRWSDHPRAQFCATHKDPKNRK